MRLFTNALIASFCLAVLAGCASSELEQRQTLAPMEQLPRPGRIIVHDFAATADDLATSSAITGRYAAPATPQSAEIIRLGRELGHRVATRLVREILAMGLPAQLARGAPPPNIGDLDVTGQFVTINKGDRTARMIVGFGKGAAELRTVVEAYQVTAAGPRLLKSLTIVARGGKGPGVAAPLVIVGGIFGRLGKAAAVSGGINLLQELGPERIEGAANRTAKTISKELRAGFRRRGWIP